MKNLIETCRSVLERERSDVGPAVEPPTTPSPTEQREIARGLAESIERAMKLGLWEHAERLASSAARMAHEHPHLADRLARLRLVQGDADAALAIIDSCVVRPASLRMLRAACLLKLGRRLEAQIDLREWSRRASAPLQARFMLALLEWQHGDADAAMEALRRNLRQLEDPRTLTALVLINAALQRRDPAAYWAQRLRLAGDWNSVSPDVDLLLQSLDLAEATPMRARPQSQERLEMLAAELQANEAVVPALAEAQRLNPHPETAMMLARALEAALSDMEDSAVAYESLAELWQIAGDPQAVSRCAIAGLQRHPSSIALANFIRESVSAASSNSADESPDVLAKIGHVPMEHAA